MHHISLIKEQRRLREISAIKRPLRYQTECAVGCIVWKTFPSKHILIVSCQKRFFEKKILIVQYSLVFMLDFLPPTKQRPYAKNTIYQKID